MKMVSVYIYMKPHECAARTYYAHTFVHMSLFLVVNVTFAPGNDFIELDQSRTELIAVSISSAIARQLDVNISSGTTNKIFKNH